jgi:hypothetical protein
MNPHSSLASNRRRVCFACMIVGLLVPVAVAAQNGVGQTLPTRGVSAAGRIVGRVVDAQTGQGLVGVIVQIPNTQLGTLSGVDGRYVLAGVPAGTVSLRLQSLGYGVKLVTDIAVPAAGAIEQNVTLEQQVVELAALEVSAGAERGSVSRALDQQRTATAIVNAVTAEQIARSPDGDAAAAMQRVSGVTVQDGKYVNVRGLGDRYTTTSLNGTRIPSPEPERKIVPLDMFPASLLQSITTSKTFTPDQPGDFSGAQVDIQTREFPAQRQATYSISLGYNDLATGNRLPFAPATGGEWLGFAGGARRLPASVKAAGNFENQPNQTDVNRMLRDFRNVWSAEPETARPNGSFGFSLGGNDNLLGRRMGYLLSGTYTRSEEVKSDETRAQVMLGPNGETVELSRFDGTTGRTSVLWGGLLNLSALVGTRTRLALNGTYNRTSDNEGRVEFGRSEEFSVPLQVQRLRFVERAVWSTQLKGEHELTPDNRLEWTLTASRVERNEPDRSEIVYVVQTDPISQQTLPPAWLSGHSEGAVRTFGELGETAYDAAANYRIALGSLSRQHFLRFGGVARNTRRDADNRSFSITSSRLTQAESQLTPEEIFDGRFASGGDAILRLGPLSQGGSYTANDYLFAGYGMVDFALSSRVRVITGARVEHSDVEVVTHPTVGGAVSATPTYTDLLPALTVNVELSDRQSLRFSASQTLARPEYRELAPVMYRDVLGGDNIIGNPDLQRTRIQNADVRWELYPASGEVLSLGLFAKHFNDPIERIYIGTSSTRVVKYVNAEAATNYGVEVELRTRLGRLASALEPFTTFSNVTFMHSRIGSGSSEASRTIDGRAMVGQAPYVVNAGLTWASQSGASSATVLYNVVGRRIVNAAEAPLPDIYEQPRNVFDLSLRLGLTGALALKVDARNLLDEPYEIRQGTVIRESYRAGRTFSLGLSLRR